MVEADLPVGEVQGLIPPHGVQLDRPIVCLRHLTFDDQRVIDAFDACLERLRASLNMSGAMNLNNNVTTRMAIPDEDGETFEGQDDKMWVTGATAGDTLEEMNDKTR